MKLFKKQPDEGLPPTQIPKEIEEVDGKFRVIGCLSLHPTLEKAVKQLNGIKESR